MLERGDAVRVFDDLSTGSRANLADRARAELVVGDVRRDELALKAGVAGMSHVVPHLAALPSVARSLVKIRSPRAR